MSAADLEGVSDQESGYRDHCSTSCSARSHHHQYHLRPKQAEETGCVLHQSTTHQRLCQGLSLLLWQGEKESMKQNPLNKLSASEDQYFYFPRQELWQRRGWMCGGWWRGVRLVSQSWFQSPDTFPRGSCSQALPAATLLLCCMVSLSETLWSSRWLSPLVGYKNIKRFFIPKKHLAFCCCFYTLLKKPFAIQ